MLKRYWAKGLGLVLLTAASMLVGGFVLAGLGSHSALAQLGTTAPVVAAPVSITATVATPALSAATTPDTLRDRIIDMMKDHMGFTDQLASDWADTMTGHMQAVHGDWAGIMLDQMDEYMDQYVYGYGMMNGAVPGDGSTPRNMMNGIAPNTMMGAIGSQPGSNGTSGNPGTLVTPRTMMNGSVPGARSTPSTMMGETPATTTTSSGSSSSGSSATTSTTQDSVTTPSAQGPGTMMNSTTGTASQGTTSGMMGGGGMGSLR